MSNTFDYGPLRTYEITWKSGHIETLQAHQVMLPPDELGAFSFSSMFGGPLATMADRTGRVVLHGEIEGRWTLVLSAPADEIHTIRLVTAAESVPVADQNGGTA